MVDGNSIECNAIECNSVERPNIYPNLNATPLSDQQHFRLNKTNEIKDYSVADIKERELMSKIHSKYIVLCDYFDRSLIVLSGIVKKLLKTTRDKKKKYNKIIMLARNKLNSIESNVSEALINNEISHEDFMIIINEKKKLLRTKIKH